jgi:hypothetical protein
MEQASLPQHGRLVSVTPAGVDLDQFVIRQKRVVNQSALLDARLRRTGGGQ